MPISDKKGPIMKYQNQFKIPNISFLNQIVVPNFLVRNVRTSFVKRFQRAIEFINRQNRSKIEVDFKNGRHIT
jgi:hypothetical protein